MNDIKTMPKIGAEDLRSLAGVIARRNLAAAPDQCADFYGTEQGKKMLALIEIARTKKAARKTGGKERRKTG